MQIQTMSCFKKNPNIAAGFSCPLFSPILLKLLYGLLKKAKQKAKQTLSFTPYQWGTSSLPGPIVFTK